MNLDREIQDRADLLQKEMHEMINLMRSSFPGNTGPKYDDLLTIYMLSKLAQLELKIEKLKN